MRASRRFAGASLVAIAALLAAQPLYAQAFQGAPVTSLGSVFINRATPGVDNIAVLGPLATINWTPTDTGIGGGAINFLPSGSTVNFASARGAPYTVLNRIIAVDPGRVIAFNGAVNSDGIGAIWFYAPGGILVGANARFNVGSLLLTANDPRTDANGGFLPGGNSFSLAAAAGSTAGVTIAAGAQINAARAGSYVIAVAPTVTQAGAITVNGSAALVAANSVDFTLNAGLFDITVTAGTDAGGTAISHTGITTGAAGTASGPHRAYLVAVPRNDAITLFVGGAGSQLGFDIAGAADVAGNAIILSAGHNVSGDTIVSQAVNGVRSDLTIEQGSYTSNLTGVSTGDTVAASLSGNTSFAAGLDLTGVSSAQVGGRNGFVLSVVGDTRISTDARNASGFGGASRTGGQSLLFAEAGGSISIGGGVTLSADGVGDDNFNGIDAGGTGTGGIASVFTKSGGSIAIVGDATVNARGTGGNDDGPGGGSGVGGSALMSAGGAGSLRIGGSATADATGFGGNYVGEFSVTAPPTGSGGQASIDAGDSTLVIGGGITILAEGQGNSFDTFAGGGNAFGGTAALSVGNGTLAAAQDIVVSAQARGSGRRSDGNGGNATGGTAQISASGPGSITSTGSFVSVDAQGLAGPGDTNLGGTGGVGGVGGIGSGGLAQIAAVGGNLQFLASDADLRVDASGSGSSGNTGSAGFGGTASIEAQGGGTIRIDARVTVAATATGGDSQAFGTGGNATAGSAIVQTAAGSAASLQFIDTLAIDATAIGGNGGGALASDGGNATGGQVQLRALSGSVNVAGGAALYAEARGGGAGVGASGLGGGRGGAAQGGVVAVAGSGGILQLASGLDIFANASGGQTLAGDGGSGAGGSARIVADAAGDVLVAGAVNGKASGFGAAGGGLGNGGAGTGGLVQVRANDGTIGLGDALQLTAAGVGGGGGGAGGAGGSGVGGNAASIVDGGSMAVAGVVMLDVNGTGGDGGRGSIFGPGGAGLGGFGIAGAGPAAVAGGASDNRGAGLSISANGVGGAGGTSGTSQFGSARLGVDGGTASFGTVMLAAAGVTPVAVDTRSGIVARNGSISIGAPVLESLPGDFALGADNARIDVTGAIDISAGASILANFDGAAVATPGVISADAIVLRAPIGIDTLAGLVSASTIALSSAGAIRVGDLAALAGIDAQAGGTLMTGNVDGGALVTLLAGTGVIVGNVRGETDISIVGGSDVTTGIVSAGDSIRIAAGSDGRVRTAALVAGLLRPSRDPAAGYQIGISGDGGVSIGDVSALGTVALQSIGGDIDAGTVTTRRSVVALAAGNVGLGGVTTGAGETLYIANADSTAQLPGFAADPLGPPAGFDFARLFALAPVRVGGGISLAGPVSTGTLAAAAAAGFAAAGSIAASQRIGIDSGGVAAFGGRATAPLVALRSLDIAIGNNGGIGDAATSRISLGVDPAANAIRLGGTLSAGEGGAWQLDASEIASLRADQIDIDVLGQAPQVVMVDAFALVGTADAAVGNANFAVRTPGAIAVTGAVTASSLAATDTLLLQAGQRLTVVTDSGGALRLNGAGAPDTAGSVAGVLDLRADQIWVGTAALLDQLAADPAFAGRDLALGATPAQADIAGAIGGGTLRISSSGSVLIQNSGNVFQRAGFSVGSMTITATANAAGSAAGSGLTDVVINGRAFGTTGVLINQHTIDQIAFAPALASYTPTSSVNGCIIGATCILYDTGLFRSIANISPNIRELTEARQQARDRARDSAERFPQLRIDKLIDAHAVTSEPPIDEPITSGANSSLWLGSAPTSVEGAPK